MSIVTRQQLINLINQYIYTNGQQRINASQLNEILIEIANAFVMEGGSTASGIDEVLEEGSTVSDGREITNSFGGKVQLAVAALDITTLDKGPEPVIEPYEYVGMNVGGSSKIGQIYVDKRKTVIGNIRTNDLTKTLFEVPMPIPDDELYVGTIYNLERDPIIDGQFKFGAGVANITLSSDYGTGQSIENGAAGMRVQSFSDENTNADLTVGIASIESYISNGFSGFSGPQSTAHVQTYYSHVWKKDNEDVATINQSGISLSPEKRVTLSSGGSAPTAGLTPLAGGTATVNTAAVRSNSIISLTVQEAGIFTGNIRVSAKTPGDSFKISSTSVKDTCSVFWQIIDI